jgi:hypothetical protein
MPSYESSLEKLAKARAKGRRLALMGLFLLWNNERFFLNPLTPEWKHYNPIRWQPIFE